MSLVINLEKILPDMGLSFHYETASERVGLLGPLDSGKSLALRIIAGLENPDKGQIILRGRALYDSAKGINVKPRHRNVGYLGKDYGLFPNMNIFDNIACGFKGRSYEREIAVNEYISRYHLGGLEEKHPSDLTMGQQLRAAFARMMIANPQMVLLDDPFACLDGYQRDLNRRDIQLFLEDYQGIVMFAGYQREEIYGFCDELVLINDGTVFCSGKTEEIYENPVYLGAAQLTGCKNFSRIRRLDEYSLEAIDWGIELRTEKPVEEDHTHVGIHAHWLRPVDNMGENTMEVRVAQYTREAFGHQLMLENINAPGSELMWCSLPKSAPQEAPESITPKYIRLPKENLMLLKRFA